MTGLLVIGGDAPGRAALAGYRGESALVVAADSGLETAIALGLDVDLVVGDMDSIRDTTLLDRLGPDRVRRYPVDKDETDTEIGLRLLGERGCERIVVVGGGGGRLDHFLGVYLLFERPAPPSVWITATAVLELLTGARVVDARPGEVVSLFPVGTGVRVRSTRGLRWPLDGMRLDRGHASLSNVATSEKIEVRIARGGLILVRSIRGTTLARDKLDEMSHDLSDRERKDLLKRLEVSPQESSAESIRPVELPAEERVRLIAKDMEKVSWFTRLLIWLEGLLTGRDAKTVFVGVKVRELKTRIRQVNAALTGFESRDLRPRFAEIVYDVFYRATALVDICRAYTKDKELQDFAFTSLIEEGWSGARKNLEDLVPLEEMEKAYGQKTSVEEIRKLVVRSMGDYLKTVPAEFLTGLSERIRPLFHLERLVLFSYGSLFRYFNYVVREPLEQKHPHFDHAPAMLLISHMERLLYGIHLAREVPDDWSPPGDLIRLYLLKRPNPPAAEETENETKRIQEASTRVLAAVKEAAPRLPLLDLVRYFRRDPYYRLQFAPPSLDLLGSYARVLKDRFFDQLREKLDTVKLRALSHRTMDFFRTPLAELSHYNDRPDFDFRKLGLPYFSNTRSLGLVWNYLSRMYKGYVRDVVQVANGTVLTANKLVQNRLMQSDAQLEDVEARINHFDRGLAPDAEDGKTMFSFRHNLSSDALQQRFYKTFIADKDRQARALIEKAQTHLTEIMRVLEDTVNSPTETIKAILRSNQLLRGKTQTLLALMTTRRDNLREFLSILDQTVAYDRGI